MKFWGHTKAQFLFSIKWIECQWKLVVQTLTFLVSDLRPPKPCQWVKSISTCVLDCPDVLQIIVEAVVNGSKLVTGKFVLVNNCVRPPSFDNIAVLTPEQSFSLCTRRSLKAFEPDVALNYDVFVYWSKCFVCQLVCLSVNINIVRKSIPNQTLFLYSSID